MKTGWRVRVWRNTIVRWSFYGFAGMLVLVGGVVAIAESYTALAAANRIADSVDGLPMPAGEGKPPALVLGCSPTLGGWRNMYFVHRINTAAELWKSGKISCLVVSGDNSSHDYNEPEAMKRALVKLGVPEDKVICDYAGLRTLDSVVRMKEIFGAEKMVIVSQEFHNRRALAIARSNGIDATAINAQDINNETIKGKSWLRERGARVAMILDLWVLDTSPKYLGEKITLPR